MSLSDYDNARKAGLQSYRHEISRGRYPYLPALEEMLPNLSAMKEETIGVCEIPIYLVCGTLTKGRQEAFAKNYILSSPIFWPTLRGFFWLITTLHKRRKFIVSS